ncbi:MAG: hypothetical protein PHU14_13465, partial [Methylovulum sp.]|nr:hypothetical protein [Methylovulum sp.]
KFFADTTYVAVKKKFFIHSVLAFSGWVIGSNRTQKLGARGYFWVATVSQNVLPPALARLLGSWGRPQKTKILQIDY